MMFLIVKKNFFGKLKVVTECHTRGHVINWFKSFGDRSAFVIKATDVEEFVKKNEG